MQSPAHKSLSPALVVAALGVVYGDIGTSPLYAFKESIAGEHGAGLSTANVLGVLSMIFWAITLVVSVKYVLIVLRANNGGEGGILALLALVLRQFPAKSRLAGVAVACGLFGAAMFYGDSIITPAISVLSAIEGLEVVSPRFTQYVIPLTLLVLIVLFAVQSGGTERVGKRLRADHGRVVRDAGGPRRAADRARSRRCWPPSIPCMPWASCSRIRGWR